MQIFEITQRRPVNEINWGATAKTVGSQILQSPVDALGKRVGQDLNSTPDPVGSAEAMGAATEAAEPVIRQQAVEQQALWDKSVAAMLKQGKVSNISQLNSAQPREALMSQVQKMLRPHGIVDYTQLPNLVDAASFGGQGKAMAKQTATDITAIINEILTGSPAKDAWYRLSKKIYAAGQQAEFRADRGGAGVSRGAGFRQLAQTAQQAGLTAQQMRITTPPNIPLQRDPKVNALLQAMGLQQAPAAAPAQQQTATAP
jgi:hypothetical protein